MKIKLLDELIEKIMTMEDGPVESKETPALEGAEDPGIQAKEALLGQEKPMEEDPMAKIKALSR